MVNEIIITEYLEFEWDSGNLNKNFIKHSVTSEEIELAFQDPYKVGLSDNLHSVLESRFILLASVMCNRKLFIVYTIRGNKIRVISARDLNRREREIYEKNA